MPARASDLAGVRRRAGPVSSSRCVILALRPELVRRPQLAQTDENHLPYRFQVGALGPSPSDSSNSAGHPLARSQVDASGPSAAADQPKMTPSIFSLSLDGGQEVRGRRHRQVALTGPRGPWPARPPLSPAVSRSPSAPFEASKLTEITFPVDSRSSEPEGPASSRLVLSLGRHQLLQAPHTSPRPRLLSPPSALDSCGSCRPSAVSFTAKTRPPLLEVATDRQILLSWTSPLHSDQWSPELSSLTPRSPIFTAIRRPRRTIPAQRHKII